MRASGRLGALIDHLLALRRAGRAIDTPRRIDWDEAMQTIRGDLHHLIQLRQAAVRVDGPLPTVSGDAERVLHLLSHLIRNGLQYNTSPHPEVVVGATTVPDPPQGPLVEKRRKADFVSLFVRDNGIGIDAADHERIFRLFGRLRVRDEIDGAGAGLTMCRRIVEAHGGRIWVESQAGRGATFYFTLPREAAADTAAPANAVAPEPTANESAPVA